MWQPVHDQIGVAQGPREFCRALSGGDGVSHVAGEIEGVRTVVDRNTFAPPAVRDRLAIGLDCGDDVSAGLLATRKPP